MLQPILSVFLYSVQNWGLYLVLLQSLLLHTISAQKCDKLLKSSRLLYFNFGFLCFLWKFRFFLYFRCTWVCFWLVGPCDSGSSFVSCPDAARPRQGSGFDSGAELICLFFTTYPPSFLYNRYPELFPWGEVVTGTCTLCPPYVFMACFVIGHNELQV